MGLGLLACPLCASNVTTLSDVPHLPSIGFLQPWFVRLRPNSGPVPSWPHLDFSQFGSGTIGPALWACDAIKLSGVPDLPWFVQLRPSFEKETTRVRILLLRYGIIYTENMDPVGLPRESEHSLFVYVKLMGKTLQL